MEYGIKRGMTEENWTKMRRKEGRFGKSLYEKISIRGPRVSYEDWPDILDADGKACDRDFPPEDMSKSDYTFNAKIVRKLHTRKNRIEDPVYVRENIYFVFLKEALPDFLDTTYEILWHDRVEKEGDVPTFAELEDTDKGVLTVESVETTRGLERIVCQLYDMA